MIRDFTILLRARVRIGVRVSRSGKEKRDEEEEEVVNPHLSQAIKTFEGSMAADVFPAHGQERLRTEQAAEKKNDNGTFERR